MKVVIPYKEKSSRCAEKNLREFHDGKSILDITVEKFQEKGHHVYLACIPSETSEARAKKLGVEQIPITETPDASFSDVLKAVAWTCQTSHQTNPIDEEEPICFWLATEISFFLENDIDDFLDRGELMLKNYGVTTTKVNRFEHFLVNKKMAGLNFDHGPWFQYSQELAETYTLAFATVTNMKTMYEYGWPYGPKGQIWVAKDPYIDINTEEEFKVCQVLWKGWNHV